MKTKIPKIWQQMKAGEQVHCKRPFHELQALAAIAHDSGIAVRLEPAPNGYWVIIDETPAQKATRLLHMEAA
jgi:hypothetical protein